MTATTRVGRGACLVGLCLALLEGRVIATAPAPPSTAADIAVITFQCVQTRGSSAADVISEYRLAEFHLNVVDADDGTCEPFTFADPIDGNTSAAATIERFVADAQPPRVLAGTSLAGAIDGMRATEFGADKLATLTIDLEDTVEPCGFAYTTAGASTANDCVRWLLVGYAADDGSMPIVLHDQTATDAAVPSARFTQTPMFSTANNALGECAVATRCGANQACVDPDPSTAEDFYCMCTPPLLGVTTVGGPATCVLDECSDPSSYAVCRAAGQVCIDSNPTTLDDWECLCPVSAAPRRGARQPAACQYTGACAANSAVCTAAGHACINVGTGFECACVFPAAGAPGVGAAARECTLDECRLNAYACVVAGQTCRDPDASTPGDWRCECSGSAAGSALAGRVLACAYAGECLSHGTTCRNAGRVCDDTDHTVAGNWRCVCPQPANGAPALQAAGASCTYEECVGAGGVCNTVGQSCVDPATALASLADWQCRCPPATVVATASYAVCPGNGDCAASGTICTGRGQRCVDPDGTANNNFECHCIAPEAGAAAVNRAATCILDECLTAGQVCRDAGQLCVDGIGVGDWTCECVRPAVGIGVGEPAACTYTSVGCALNGHTCTANAQTCVEHPSISGQWSCACAPPREGSPKQGGAATCAADPCSAGGDVCAPAGQVCVAAASTAAAAFECRCAGVATGSAEVGQPAVCTAGAACGGVCLRAGQSCEVYGNGSFACRCVPPLIGAAKVGGAATCTEDYCAGHAHICEAVGQRCVNLANNWGCECPGSSRGSQMLGIASCTPQGECADHASVCNAAGQYCVDPSPDVTGDWECHCAPPYYGAPGAQRASANCTYDACTAGRSEEVCYAQGLNCVSGRGTNADPALDYECVAFPEGGCATHFRTCTDAGQRCGTPEGNATGFECICKFGIDKRRVGGAVDVCAFGAPDDGGAGADDDDDDAACTWWCILLIVVAGLLCIGVVIALMKVLGGKKAEDDAAVPFAGEAEDVDAGGDAVQEAEKQPGIYDGSGLPPAPPPPTAPSASGRIYVPPMVKDVKVVSTAATRGKQVEVVEVGESDEATLDAAIDKAILSGGLLAQPPSSGVGTGVGFGGSAYASTGLPPLGAAPSAHIREGDLHKPLGVTLADAHAPSTMKGALNDELVGPALAGRGRAGALPPISGVRARSGSPSQGQYNYPNYHSSPQRMVTPASPADGRGASAGGALVNPFAAAFIPPANPVVPSPGGGAGYPAPHVAGGADVAGTSIGGVHSAVAPRFNPSPPRGTSIYDNIVI